jgi:arginine-tRNA-protein transferase
MAHQALSSLPFAQLPVADPTPCSYYLDRDSRYRQFRLADAPPAAFFEELLALGYRRCGDIYYQTCCDGCHQCHGYRLPVAEFRPSRNQQRVLRQNADLTFAMVDPEPTLAKERLYLAYQHAQHYTRDQQRPVPGVRPSRFHPDELLLTMHFQMYTNPPATRELQLWLGDQLVGFGIVDLAQDSASAVYFAFDPAHGARSLGTLAILRALAWAREQRLRYYYLGLYLPGHPKMTYKQRFRPAEVRSPADGIWRRLEDPPA